MKPNINKITVFLIFVIGLFYYFLFINIEKPSFLNDLKIKAETEFGLKNIIISETDEGILEVRLMNPENISKENLSIGTAYLFGYLESYINKKNDIIRIIYTFDELDIITFETKVSDIFKWKNQEIDNDEFTKRITITTVVQD